MKRVIAYAAFAFLAAAGMADAAGIRQVSYQFDDSDGVVSYAPSNEYVFCTACSAPAAPEPAPQVDLKVAVPADSPFQGEAVMPPLPQEQAEATAVSSEAIPQPPAPAPADAPAADAAPQIQKVESVPATVKKHAAAVLFDFNSAALSAEGKQALLELPKDSAYSITGFTDSKGSLKANEKVAMARAEAVAALLKENGYTVASVEGKAKCCYRQALSPSELGALSESLRKEYPQLPAGLMAHWEGSIRSLLLEMDDAASRRVEVVAAKAIDPSQPFSLLGSPGGVNSAILIGQSLTGTMKKADPVKNAENLFKLAWGKSFPSYSSFSQSPVEELYEVIAAGPEGAQIYYFSPPDKLLIGQIFNNQGQNLTEERLTALDMENAPALASFPLDDAITIGNGKTTVIEVSDPDCPFCRKAEAYFAGKDMTRRIFLTALPMHPEAPAKIKYILCAEDRAAAYQEVAEGKFDGKPPAVTAECESKAAPLMARHEEVRARLNVRGTPLFYLPPGETAPATKINGLDEARLNKAIGGK